MSQEPAKAIDLADVPRSPRTPSKRARRIIHAYRGSQKALLIIGIAFLAMGSIFTTIFCWGLPVDVLLVFTAQKTTGYALSSEIQRNVEINGRHPTKIRFAYDVAGQRYEGSSSTLDGGLIRSAQMKEPLAVEYAASRPEWARIDGETYSTFGYWPTFVLIFPVLGFGMTTFAVRSNRREIRAYRDGRATIAKVTYSGPDRSVQVNGRHPFQVRWEFQTGDGQVFEGSLSSMLQTELEELASKMEIVVLYDPEEPACNTAWIP